VPSAHAEKGKEAVQELGQQVGPLVDAYVTALEARKLKDGIRLAMAVSSVGEYTIHFARRPSRQWVSMDSILHDNHLVSG